MKSDKIILLALIVIVLVSLGSISYLLKQQEKATDNKIVALKWALDSFSATIKGLDSKIKDIGAQSKIYTDGFKDIEEKIRAAEAERKDLGSKVDALIKEVEGIKSSAKTESTAKVPENPAVTAQAVELGEIPVQK